MTQPEALRLAEMFDCVTDDGCGDCIPCRAAVELRRLNEAHDWQYRMAGERLRRVEKLEAQRDALLEALRDLVDAMTGYLDGEATALHNALIVLAKAEEKT